MEEKLKGDSWEILKHTIEAKEATRNALSINCILETHLRRHLSDTDSYVKVVSRDCILNSLDCDLLISNTVARSTADRNLKDRQVNETRQKLMVKLAGNQKLDISWCRRCTEDRMLSYGGMEPSVSTNQTQYLPVDTCHNMCAKETGNVLTDTEKGEVRVDEIGRMPLGKAEQESECEMAPTVFNSLKSGACGEEGSDEK